MLHMLQKQTTCKTIGNIKDSETCSISNECFGPIFKGRPQQNVYKSNKTHSKTPPKFFFTVLKTRVKRKSQSLE